MLTKVMDLKSVFAGYKAFKGEVAALHEPVENKVTNERHDEEEEFGHADARSIRTIVPHELVRAEENEEQLALQEDEADGRGGGELNWIGPYSE